VGVWQNAQEARRRSTQHAGFNALAPRDGAVQHGEQLGLVLGERRTVSSGYYADRGIHAQAFTDDLQDRPATSQASEEPRRGHSWNRSRPRAAPLLAARWSSYVAQTGL
jgi:hypothetical protein